MCIWHSWQDSENTVLWIYPACCVGTLVQQWTGTLSWLSLLFPVSTLRVWFRNKWHALSPVVAFPLHNTGLAVLCCGGAEGVKSLLGLTQFPTLVSTAKASNDASFLQWAAYLVHCQWIRAGLGQWKLCYRQKCFAVWCIYMGHLCVESSDLGLINARFSWSLFCA